VDSFDSLYNMDLLVTREAAYNFSFYLISQTDLSRTVWSH